MTTPSSMLYEHCGLRVRSELDLHLPIATGEGWDVDIRWGEPVDGTNDHPGGELIAWLGESDDEWWYRATSTASGHVIRFRDKGDFVVSDDLSTVEVRPDASGNPEFLPVLAAGTAMAFVLTLRGNTVLHASAVAIEGRALAFVGPSGIGKTTLAAVMCLDGATLVTDDVLVVADGPSLTVVGGATELRLREAAAPLADVRRDAPRRVTADERTALTLTACSPEPLALAALVVPSPSRTTSDVSVERLAPSTALSVLLASPRVHGWRLPDVLSRDFTMQGEVANRVPIYAATIPWGPPFDASIAPSLRELALDAPTTR